MIISCGEALVDCFNQPQTTSFDTIIGGSPLNVAVALANAGSQVALMTNISFDQFGERHLRHLKTHRVSQQYITRSEHSSGLMLVTYNSDKSASYRYYGHNTAELNFQLNELVNQDFSQVSCLHFGSFSLVKGVTANSFRHLILQQKSSCVISVDINVRTAIEPDLGIWHDEFSALMDSAHILKASAEDLCLLYKIANFSKNTALELMKKWRHSGVKLPIITDAENGAYALLNDKFIHVPAQSTKIIDTVGAGDCFMAHLLHQLETYQLLSIAKLEHLSEAQVRDALAVSIQAASFTIAHQGAVFPRQADLKL